MRFCSAVLQKAPHALLADIMIKKSRRNVKPILLHPFSQMPPVQADSLSWEDPEQIPLYAH